LDICKKNTTFAWILLGGEVRGDRPKGL
jgi:hypothetical protein